MLASAAAADVGVVEHDHRAVAAELEQRRLARRARRDLQPGRDRADEADRVRPRARGDLVADDGARAGDHREHAGRQLRVDDALGELHRAERGRGRGRPDDRVAGGERRRDQLRGHRVRPVPRRDDADDAARHAVGEDPLRRIDRGRHRAVRAASRPRRPCASRRRAPRPRRTPRRAAACPGRGSACARGRRAAPRSGRRRAPSPPLARRRTARPSRAARRSPPRSRGGRPRASPRARVPRRLARRRARRLEARARLRLDPRAADHHRVVAGRDAHRVPPRERVAVDLLVAGDVDLARVARSSADPRTRSARASGSRPRRTRAPPCVGMPTSSVSR